MNEIWIVPFLFLISAAITSEAATTPCVDENNDCPKIADDGGCMKSNVTLSMCRKSCGICLKWTGFEFQNAVYKVANKSECSRIVQTVTCEGTNNQYFECPLPLSYVNASIAYVLKDRGTVSCKVGDNWGFHASGRKLWVRNGCKGDFGFYKGPKFVVKWRNKSVLALVGSAGNSTEGSSVVCPPSYEQVDCRTDNCESNSSLGIYVENRFGKPICFARGISMPNTLKQIRVKAYCLRKNNYYVYPLFSKNFNDLNNAWNNDLDEALMCPNNGTLTGCFVNYRNVPVLSTQNSSQSLGLGIIRDNKCMMPAQFCQNGGCRSSAICTRSDPCKTTEKTCGVGSLCNSTITGEYSCTCPKDTVGDPRKRCCKLMKCRCWGDPHCNTFDASAFHFQGLCQYNFISTVLTGNDTSLVPFKVTTKQESRRNNKKVAYVRFVTLELYGSVYKLLQNRLFTVNDVNTSVPYKTDNGVQAYISGSYLTFSTEFGLTVVWDGNWRVEVGLCNAYANRVTGLCGNADGNKTNDFVNPNNQLVDLVGDKFSKYWNWGQSWRVNDDTPDAPTECKTTSVPITPPPSISCNTSSYETACSLIKSKSGPWKDCIRGLSTEFIDNLYESCVFDMCALSDNATALNSARCSAFESLTQTCYDNKFNGTIEWRGVTNCPKTCHENENLSVRTECPKTCLDPLGQFDCGELQRKEGCYCNDGYVLDNTFTCIKQSKCGCLLPDNSSLLQVGEKRTSMDCEYFFECKRPLSNVTITKYGCKDSEFCSVNSNSEAACMCKSDYMLVNGRCIKNPNITSSTVETTRQETTTLKTVITDDYEDFEDDIETSTTPKSTTQSTTKPTTLSTTKSTTKFTTKSTTQTTKKTTTKAIDPCKSNNTKCGTGAICKNIGNGEYTCLCPAGKIGDPFQKCCQTKKCNCWGDPHCLSFDSSVFHFQGICQYNFVSTVESNLPRTLVPFKIITKQERRGSNKNVAYLRLVTLTLYGDTYKFLQKKQLTINNVNTTVPYENENGVKISLYGNSLMLSTNFGLSISWDGSSKVEVALCDDYAGYVNGLCGNADGKSANDFVDPKGKNVTLTGSSYVKFWNWGESWRVNDDSADAAKECLNSTTVIPPPNNTVCANETIYQDQCKLINSTQGPWASCLKNLSQSVITGLYESCVFDLCALEGNRTAQDMYKCNTFETLTESCYDSNYSGDIMWRKSTNCEKPCGVNEIFDVREECPKTCFNLNNQSDCGFVRKREGCYCNEGYVLDNNMKCIASNKCGCTIPDIQLTLQPGESRVSEDCELFFECRAPLSNVIVNDYGCKNDEYCSTNENNKTECAKRTTTRLTQPTEITPTKPTETTQTESVQTKPVETEPTEITESVATQQTEITEPMQTEPTEITEPIQTEPTEITEPMQTESITTQQTEPTQTEAVQTQSVTFSTAFFDIATGELQTTRNITTEVITESTLAPITCGDDLVCDSNADCIVTVIGNQCKCKHPYFGSGRKCCGHDNVCYGYGDPHYRTAQGYDFDIKKNCTYLLASDNCISNSNYQIFVKQRYHFSRVKAAFIDTVFVSYKGQNFSLNNEFKVNDVSEELPYFVDNEYINAYKDGIYTVLETDLFQIKFDGMQYLKLTHCENQVCGLCGMNRGNSPEEFLLAVNEACV